MLTNWKRRLFILISLLLCYIDIANDILFFIEYEKTFVLLILLLLQPGLYLFYYWLSLLIPAICDSSSEPCRKIFISLVLKAPVYMFLCEFKLMLTPLSILIYGRSTNCDRIKHSFLSHIMIQSIFQSLPISIYQWDTVLSDDRPEWFFSPIISSIMVLYGMLTLNLIRKMNTGGLTWIQTPKPTLQFYSKIPTTLI